MSCPSLPSGAVLARPKGCGGLHPPPPPPPEPSCLPPRGTPRGGGDVNLWGWLMLHPATGGLSATITSTGKIFIFGKNVLSTENIYNCVLDGQLITLGLSTA